MNIEIKTTVTITPKQIADLMVTALEGGSNHWVKKANLTLVNGEPKESPWYADPDIYASSFEIKLTDIEDGSIYTLNRMKLLEGLTKLADQTHDRHDCFRSLLDDNIDAEDADVILQVAVHGEIIFG